jgi:hypothetical protein
VESEGAADETVLNKENKIKTKNRKNMYMLRSILMGGGGGYKGHSPGGGEGGGYKGHSPGGGGEGGYFSPKRTH